MKLIDALKFNGQGLIPVIIANVEDGRPLTLCYMNRDALAKTIGTGKVHLFRRSRGRLMQKGEISGHVQEVKGIFPDCEGRSLMITVKQHVGACHAGYMSCYFRQYDAETDEFRIVEEQIFDPKQVY
jgi:phosphoribosyl-AMP cyclohydrolase